MKRSTVFLGVLALLLTQAPQAATKADSILTFTGGARTKLAWIRLPWCDVNYNPVQAYKADGFNSSKHTQLLAFDTQDGKTRYIDSTIGSHMVPRFTRKNGNYIIWNDVINRCSWIRDYAGTQPKRKLLDGTQGDYLVAACGWTPTTDSEYVYLLGSYDGTWLGRTIIRVPLKADYTADMTKKYTVPTVMDWTTICNQFDCGDDPNPWIDIHLSASENGLYMVLEYPQPNIGLLNTVTGAFLGRHNSADEYGCQQTIAPDNSYRMYHLDDSHSILRMWDANLSTTNWSVPINANLPGNTGSQAFTADMLEPRWSNHPRFFTEAYPFNSSGVRDAIFGMSATQVKALAPNQSGNFVLGKFSTDYKSVEGTVLVSGLDVRNREQYGDAWITYAPVSVSPNSASVQRVGQAGDIRVNGALVELALPSRGKAIVSITNTAGRVIAQASGTGRITCLIAGEPAGMYVVRVSTDAGVSVIPVMVTAR